MPYINEWTKMQAVHTKNIKGRKPFAMTNISSEKKTGQGLTQMCNKKKLNPQIQNVQGWLTSEKRQSEEIWANG